MPSVFSQNNDHYSPIFSGLIKLIKLWARTCVICLLLPFFLICFPFCLLLILPFFGAYLWAVFLCKIFNFLSPSSLLRILFNFGATTSSKKLGSNISKSCDDDDEDEDNKNELLAKSLEDKQVSIELDPSEIPSFSESDIEDEEKSKLGKEAAMAKICSRHQEAAASWRFLVRRKQPQSFYDVLSYWKSKEKGEE